MADVFYTDGTQVPPEKVSEAISNGTARWKKGVRVRVSGADGKRFDVDGNDVWDAIQKGAHPETPDEQAQKDLAAQPNTIGGAAAAVGLGAASTLSFGASDVLLGGNKTVQDISKKYEVARMAGEVGGLALPILGELSGAAKAESFAAKGLQAVTAPARGLSRVAAGAGEAAAGIAPKGLKTVAKGAVSAGIEGTAFGASRELSRQAMGNEDYSLEKIASAGAVGGLLGMGTGGALSGLGALGKGAFSKATTKTEGEGVAAVGRAEEVMLASRKAEIASQRAAGEIDDVEASRLLEQADYLHKTVRLTPAERAAARGYGLNDAAIGRVGVDKVKIAMREALDNPGMIPPGVKALKDDLASKTAKLDVRASELGRDIGAVFKAADDRVGASTPVKITSEDPNWLLYARMQTPSTERIPTWGTFLKERMGAAMKEYGGHGPAVKALGEEFRRIKAGGTTKIDQALEQVAAWRKIGTPDAVEAASKLEAETLALTIPVTEREVIKAQQLNSLSRIVGELEERGGAINRRVARKLRGDYEERIFKAKSFSDLHSIDTEIRLAISGIKREASPMSAAYAAATNKLRTEIKDSLTNGIESLVPGASGKLKVLDELYGAVSSVSKETTASAAANRGAPAAATVGEVGSMGLAAGFGAPGVGALYTVPRMAYRQWKENTHIQTAWAKFRDDMAKRSANKGAEMTTAISSAAKAGAVSALRALPAKGAVVADNYAERAHRAAEIKVNPAASASKIAMQVAAVTAVDPVQGRRLTQLMTDDLLWLDNAAPKAGPLSEMLDFKRYDKILQRADSSMRAGGTKGGGEEKKKRGGKASAGELAGIPLTAAESFVRTTDSLADPMSAVAQVKQGHLIPEVIPVLHERRRETLAAVTREFDDVEAQLASRGETMGYTAKIQASLITGKSYDVSMTPEYISMVQGIWDERNKARALQESGEGPSPVNAPKPKQWSSETVRNRANLLKTSAQEGLEENV